MNEKEYTAWVIANMVAGWAVVVFAVIVITVVLVTG